MASAAPAIETRGSIADWRRSSQGLAAVRDFVPADRRFGSRAASLVVSISSPLLPPKAVLRADIIGCLKRARTGREQTQQPECRLLDDLVGRDLQRQRHCEAQ